MLLWHTKMCCMIEEIVFFLPDACCVERWSGHLLQRLAHQSASICHRYRCNVRGTDVMSQAQM